MQVKVTPDGMQAYLILSEPPGNRNSETWINDIHETLKKSGVVRGIDEGAIRQAVETALAKDEFPLQVKVAGGKKAEPGVNGWIRFSFELGGKDPSAIAEQRKSHVVTEQTLTRPLVRAGEILAVIEPPQRGVDGYTVLGATLTAGPLTEAHLKAGSGVQALNDGRTFVVAPDMVGYVDYVEGALLVQVLISVSPDAMEAQLTVHPFSGTGTPLDVGDVERWLTQHGVTCGICREGVDAAVAHSRRPDVPIRSFVVAQGEPPEAGEDARIELLFQKEPLAGQAADTEGRIDYWERGFLHRVNEGDLLARKTPPTPGKAGRDVRGRMIAPVAGKDIALEATGEAVLSEDGLECRAGKAGVAVVVAPAKIGVFQEYTVPGDVDFTTGNLHMDGSLTIQGWIRTGFRVSATGDVVVYGGVESAVLEMDANLVVKGGITGGDQGNVRTRGCISARFIENARIEAGGDVTVVDGILSSRVTAHGRVIATAGKGCITGGVVQAVKGIEVNELGSRAAQQTIVDVGLDAEARAKLVEMEHDCALYRRNQQKIAKAFAVLSRKSRSQKLPPEEAQALAKLARYRRDIQQKHRAIADFWKGLLEVGAAIKVRRAVYEGTTVFVFGRRMEIREDMLMPGEFVLDMETGHVAYRSQSSQ